MTGAKGRKAPRFLLLSAGRFAANGFMPDLNKMHKSLAIAALAGLLGYFVR